MTTGEPPVEPGSIVGERGEIPMSSGTMHHEAGHAMACEHFGFGWVIYGPNYEENSMGRTDPVRVPGSPPLTGFTVEDAAVIALAGWAAECRHRKIWDDPYIREGADHDFVFLVELDDDRRESVTERAKDLVANEWWRVEEIAAEMQQRFG
jgi:hypothetical protein